MRYWGLTSGAIVMPEGRDGMQACEAWLSDLMVYGHVSSGIVGRGWTIWLGGSGRSSTCSIGCSRCGRGRPSDRSFCAYGGRFGGLGEELIWLSAGGAVSTSMHF